MNFKKIIALTLTVCLLTIMLCVPAFAASINETQPIEGVTWFRGEGYGLVEAPAGYATQAIFPIEDIPVGTEFIDLTGFDVYVYTELPELGDGLGLLSYEYYSKEDGLLSYIAAFDPHAYEVQVLPFSDFTITDVVSDEGTNMGWSAGYTFGETNINLFLSGIGYIPSSLLGASFGMVGDGAGSTLYYILYNPDGAAEPEPEVDASVIGSITTFVNSAISWVGSFTSAIVGNPIIFIFVLCALIGLGVGWFSCLKR